MVIRNLAWLAAVVLGASSLSAEPSPDDIVRARRLFSEARTAEDARDWSTAASKLRGAISVKETAGLRFHLAYCEEQQSMLVEALADYERSEELGKQSNEDFVAQLPARRESLHKRIPTVTILTPPSVADVVITVDGRIIPATFLGKPIPLNPGSHKLNTSAPGRVGFSSEVLLKEGDALVTSAPMPAAEEPNSISPAPSGVSAVSSLPSPPVAPPLSVPPARASSPARTYALVGETVLALGGLAVGIGYSVAATRADDNAQRVRDGGQAMGCASSNPGPDCNELQHFVDLAEKDRFIALLGFIGAGASTAALAATLVLWPASSVKAAIIPYWTPTATGLSFVGRL